jgi:PAS domain S-box-containing protein
LKDVDLSLIDRLVVPASLHDLRGRFVHMNEPAERASGCSNAELLGRHLTVLLPPEAHKKVEAQFHHAVERGEPTDFETVFVDGTGHLRGVRVQQLPLRSGDEIVGVLILAFDAVAPAEPIGPEPQPRLTPRQREVLDLIASGLSTSFNESGKRLTGRV